MTLKELLQLDDPTILQGSDSSGNRYLGQMLKYYSELFDYSCFSCPSKFPAYLNQLRNHLAMKNPEKKGDFQLTQGVTIPIFGTSEVYSDRNITDEAALKILSRNRNAIKLFKKHPKDWEEQVEAYEKGQNISSLSELAELKHSAIKVLFPDAEGRSKEDLLKDIAEKYPELDTERKAREEAEKKEAELKAKQEAEQNAEAERKAKEEAELKAKQEAEAKAKADQKAKEDSTKK